MKRTTQFVFFSFLYSFFAQADLGVTELLSSFTGGSTRKGFGVTNENTTALNYNGPLSFAPVFKGVPLPTLTAAQQTIVNNLNAVPETETFGFLKPTGKFSLFQWGLTLRQNIHNWFVSLTVPFKKIKVSDITFTDLGTEAEQQIPAWVAFKENMTEMLAAYGMQMTPYSLTGLSDITVELGKNFFLKTPILKEINGTLKTGFIIPSGKKAARNRIFALPLGNDGQVGIPLSLNTNAQFNRLFGLSFSAAFIFFINQITSWRMKTNLNQNMAYLALGAANRTMKPFQNISIAINTTPGPLTLSVGYSYLYIGTVVLHPEDKTIFNESIVNTAEMLTSSYFHAATIGASYQPQLEGNALIPHISLFASIPFAGNTIFNLPLIESNIGFQFVWSF